ncbi:MAG: c-type cytochrome [Magnetospirillum sp.]|nr:c-type cytochrome [Magnetospirillum sp.]
METSRIFLTAASCVLVAWTASAALAADGKALFADKGCTACHGEDAKTPLQEGYPKLAGQNAEYVFRQLQDIKAGSRANAQVPDTMAPIAADLTEADNRALADYLAGLDKFTPATARGPADAAGRKLYMSKTCIACHGKEGLKPVLPTYPSVAGQDKAYLAQQMRDIKSSARKNGETAAMQPVMHLVNEDEIDAIADYLSNVK